MNLVQQVLCNELFVLLLCSLVICSLFLSSSNSFWFTCSLNCFVFNHLLSLLNIVNLLNIFKDGEKRKFQQTINKHENAYSSSISSPDLPFCICELFGFSFLLCLLIGLAIFESKSNLILPRLWFWTQDK